MESRTSFIETRGERLRAMQLILRTSQRPLTCPPPKASPWQMGPPVSGPFESPEPSQDQVWRARSAALSNDPKMKEMERFMDSHAHQDRLQRRGSAIREAILNCAPPCERPRVDPLVPRARLDWRIQFDKAVRRLMDDTELDFGAGLNAEDANHMRCKHLDGAFEFYERNGLKEVRKERDGPAYLRFRDGEPAMPGSLRGQRSAFSREPAPVCVTRSRPSLRIAHDVSHGRVLP